MHNFLIKWNWSSMFENFTLKLTMTGYFFLEDEDIVKNWLLIVKSY